MKQIIKFVLIISFIIRELACVAQIDTKNICTVEDNRLIFRLDKRWTEEQKREVSMSYDLDSLLMDQAYRGIPVIVYDSIEWIVTQKDSKIIYLSKGFGNILPYDTNKYTPFAIDLLETVLPSPTEVNSISYGINDFSKKSVFAYKDGIAQFFLPGNKNAKNVYLSGTFNEWSTMNTPMQFCDSGWVVKLRIPAGKYLYKYIKDGQWTLDPNNKQKDEHNVYNSVLYCYNHVFRLKGYPDAHKVMLTGSFINWNRKGLQMQRTNSGWELPIFFREGTYFYKFIVNKEWITDSENPLIREDGNGHLNSVLEIGEKYTFNLDGYTDAEKVILTGGFNNWNASELIMEKTSTGWKLDYTIAEGNHEYKYIVDNQWIIDHTKPYTNGIDKFLNSVLVINPNYTFVLNSSPDANTVCVSGDFNNWSPSGYSMKKVGKQWIFPIHLKPGKCRYKYIVDGNWIIDVDNPLWEDNEHGTGNSVLWIKSKR